MFETMTEKDLLGNLLTADGRGAGFKEKCLAELIRRRVCEELERENRF